MKKCPTCERTFEDSMRFCQSDGTPLVEDAPPLDPYKTMVARPDDFAAVTPSVKEEEVLDIPPEADPLKTMYASEEEIRREMRAHDATNEQVMDIPPLAPEPPKFSEPSLNPPPFGETPPPPSPFAAPSSADTAREESPVGKTTPPIPSPFDNPKPSTYEPPAPNFPQFKDPEPAVSNVSNPFEPQSPAMPDWTPPPAIEPSVQNQGFGQGNPSSPPPSGESSQNKTLAIVSLGLSILSIPCCGLIIFGIAGGITGFLAKGKADANPNEYGGRGLALAGIGIGVITTLVGIVANALALLGIIPMPKF